MERFNRFSKNIGRVAFALCLYYCPIDAGCQPVRNELQQVYTSQVGVREATGHNDGKEVEKYLRSVGLGKGYAWCAAFVAWSHKEVNIPNPESAWSPDWFRSNVVYRADWRKQNITVLPGMVAGIYFPDKKRIAHIFFIDSSDNNNYYTVEGNTNGAGSREGDGVYRKIRPKKSVYAIADYCFGTKEFIKQYHSIIQDATGH